MENELPPDIAELAKKADEQMTEISANRAAKSEGGIMSKLKEAHNMGYTPEIATGLTALGTAKYLTSKAQSNYYQNLRKVVKAVDDETKLVRSLNAKQAQPFSADGKTVVNKNRPTVSKARGANSRLGTVTPNTLGIKGGVSSLTNAERIALARRMTAQQMVRAISSPFEPSGYSVKNTALANPSAKVDVRPNTGSVAGKPETITVTAENIAKGKTKLPPVLTAGQKAGEFVQKIGGKAFDILNSKWVQRPLFWADAGYTTYNMPQRFRDEVALMEREKQGVPTPPDAGYTTAIREALGSDSTIRPYVVAGSGGLRLAGNYLGRYIPEMTGLWNMPEKMSSMAKRNAELEIEAEAKKRGRPLTQAEIDEINLLNAKAVMSMGAMGY